MRIRMAFLKKVWKGFKKFQSKIDLTPKLIRISEKYAKKDRINIALFVFFLLAGFFGMFIPIIQGWLAVALSFTFLGIKPVNNFLENNRKAVSNVGSLLFIVAVGSFLITTGAWALGYSEDSPIDNIFKVLNYGKEDFQSANEEVFSVIGVDYNNTVQTFSVINYDQDQGFSTIASSD